MNFTCLCSNNQRLPNLSSKKSPNFDQRHPHSASRASSSNHIHQNLISTLINYHDIHIYIYTYVYIYIHVLFFLLYVCICICVSIYIYVYMYIIRKSHGLYLANNMIWLPNDERRNGWVLSSGPISTRSLLLESKGSSHSKSSRFCDDYP